MGAQFAVIVGWMLGLVLAYLLLTHAGGAATIVQSSSSGGASLLKTLQGR
jgi:hypothetical protein